jgi:hypothetical protein
MRIQLKFEDENSFWHPRTLTDPYINVVLSEREIEMSSRHLNDRLLLEWRKVKVRRCAKCRKPMPKRHKY